MVYYSTLTKQGHKHQSDKAFNQYFKTTLNIKHNTSKESQFFFYIYKAQILQLFLHGH